jgi:HEAT repeat protein
MEHMRRAGLSLALGSLLMVISGYGAWSHPVADKSSVRESMDRNVLLLRAGSPQQKAAAAYWLGQQREAAAKAVKFLVEILGDSTQVNPTQYRSNKVLDKMTVGEEAAAALVNIGQSSIEPLIRVLKSSPDPEARKNAAWALGALHDTGATGRI